MKQDREQILKELRDRSVTERTIGILDRENLIDSDILSDVREDELIEIGVSSTGDRKRILSMKQPEAGKTGKSHLAVVLMRIVLPIAVIILILFSIMFLQGFLKARDDIGNGLSFIECKFNEKSLDPISAEGYQYYYENFSGMGRFSDDVE